MSDIYQPLTSLETAVRNAMAGIGDEHAVLAELLRSDICVPSAGAVRPDGAGLTPLLLRSARFGTSMILAYDDVRHIDPQAAARAPHSLTVAGEWLVASMARDRGITLFVGPGVGCELSPELLAGVRQDQGRLTEAE